MKYINQRFWKISTMSLVLCIGAPMFVSCNNADTSNEEEIIIDIDEEIASGNITISPTGEAVITEMPVYIKKPVATPTPKPTEKPTATVTPKPTIKTEAKVTPKPTVKPAATATPKPTVKPEATVTPKPTDKPAAIATPKPTEKPNATVTPKPTVKPVATPTPKEVELEDGYLTEKQLNDKINALVKKYPKVSKSDIKIRVIGANLDYINDDVLYSILDISSYTELKKYATSYSEAMERSLLQMGLTWSYKHVGADKPKYEYKADVKMQDLFFDKQLIKQAKYFDSLINNLIYYTDRETTIMAGIDIVAYFFDYYYHGYESYSKGEVYKFGDPAVGDAASYAIDFYTFNALYDNCITQSYFLTLENSREEAAGKIKDYIDDAKNPITVRMNSIKKLVKSK